MSCIDKLLEGVEVEWDRFEEIGVVSGAGVDKKTYDDEKSIKLLNYMDVYRNRHLTNDIPSMTVTASVNKIEQCNVRKGDIFFTPSSEVLNDIGNSAVALEDLDGVVYSYHIMRLRLNAPNLITSLFISYMLGSDVVQKQINKMAKGITRFGLTKTQWETLQIPIPPLEVQKEIVRILDTVTELINGLTKELTKELNARKKQYWYYRDQLFSFAEDQVEMKTLNEIGEFQRGKRFVKSDMISEGVPCIHYGEMYTHYDTWADETKSFLSEEQVENKKLRVAERGDVIIVAAGETIEDIGKGTAWLGDEGVVIHDACFSYRSQLNPKFVAYFTRTKHFHDQIKKHISSGKISAINSKGLGTVSIPIPSQEEQKRIVAILDKFDLLTTSISEALPKEILLRKKQYDYYRDMLLTFSKDSVEA